MDCSRSARSRSSLRFLSKWARSCFLAWSSLIRRSVGDSPSRGSSAEGAGAAGAGAGEASAVVDALVLASVVVVVVVVCAMIAELNELLQVDREELAHLSPRLASPRLSLLFKLRSSL
jgi:hypothetical protein